MKRKSAMTEELRAQYEKQLRRIKRLVRSATKRGYDFPETVIPSRPKTITEASVRKAASITPDILYKKATYKKETGEVITGIEGRKHERSQAAIKAAKTRKAKQIEMPTSGYSYAPSVGRAKHPANTEPAKKSKSKTKSKSKKKSQSKTKDKAKQRKKETPREKHYKSSGKKKAATKEPVDRTDVVLENVLSTLEEMIRTWVPSSNWSNSLIIIKTKDKNLAKSILNSAISQLGRNQVAKNCEKYANEIIPMLEEILYASGSKEGNFKDGRTQVNFDIIRFQSMLLDRATTPEENWQLVDVMESFVDEEADEDTEQYHAAYTTTLSNDAETDYSTDLEDSPYNIT